MQEKVSFLGYELNRHGITPSQKHIEALRTWPTPKTSREVRSFIGCVNFFRNWIPERGKLMKPLTELTRKDCPFKWEERQQRSFDKIKSVLTSHPTLRHPDFTKQFTLFTDASHSAIGAVLCQTDKDGYYAVSYLGRATTPQESRYSVTDLEALAIVFAVKEWEVYLTSRPFVIKTDHKALTHIFQGNGRLTPKLARYAMYLNQFQFEISHIKGTENEIADALSRRLYDFSQTATDEKLNDFPSDMGIGELFTDTREAISVITRSQTRKLQKDADTDADTTPVTNRQTDRNRLHQPSIQRDGHSHPNKHTDDGNLAASQNQDSRDEQQREEIDADDMTQENLIRAQRQDEFCLDLIRMLENDILPDDTVRRKRCLLREFDFCLKDGILTQMWMPLPATKKVIFRAVIPKCLQESYVRMIHTSPLSAHLGVDKTIALIKERFIFPKLYDVTRRVISSCDICQSTKPYTKRIQRPPGLYDLASQPFDRIHVDFAGPLPLSIHGNRYISVVTDSTSGYLIAWPARTLHAEAFARQMFTRVACIFGPARSIVSDNASNFRSNLWAQVARHMGSKLVYTAPYTPNSNGAAEAGVKKIMQSLRALSINSETRWDEHLPAAVYALNNTLHTSHNLTPHNIIFGKCGRIPFDTTSSEVTEQPLTTLISEMQESQNQALQSALHFKSIRRERQSQNDGGVDNSTDIIPGRVVFWKKPIRTSQGKLARRNDGPFIVCKRNVFTAQLKHLHTGQVHKLAVNIKQLIPARHYQIHPDDNVDQTVLYATSHHDDA